MTNEQELAKGLVGLGFTIVNAAGFSEQEKSYIFGLAKVIVLPIGAGMTNLVRSK